MGWMKKNMLSWPDLFFDSPLSHWSLNLFLFLLSFSYCTAFPESPYLWIFVHTISSSQIQSNKTSLFSPSWPRCIPFTHKHTPSSLSCSLSLLPQLLDLSFFQSLSQISSVHLWIVSFCSCAPVQPDSSLHPSLSLSCLSPLPSSISPAPLFISSELSFLSSLLHVMATKFLLDPWVKPHSHHSEICQYIIIFLEEMCFLLLHYGILGFDR